jgi:fructose-1,6-bisphosphatase/inositol monophosphatase family enzyme
MTTAEAERARKLLHDLHLHIQRTLIGARQRGAKRFAEVAAVTTADTLYRIDQISEEAIFDWFGAHWPKAWPVQLVMEGVEDGDLVTFPRGTSPARIRFTCIIDPIDGTRGLMYDKRSAWILTGLAPYRGAQTKLGDIEVAVMTELPTTKQWRADEFSAIRGRGRAGLHARGRDVRMGKAGKILVRPSTATDFKHGFASLVRFFPDGKALCAQLEEALWRELHGETKSSPLIFDDQYISTGGQLYELLMGHDRMIGDIRPRIFAKLGIRSSLTCHPYDICTELIFREAGGIVETPEGRPLNEPLNTTAAVSWIGYANEGLARQIRPVLRRLLKRYL